jgi:glycosyltransferase involved in cell wall biosynthesis
LRILILSPAFNNETGGVQAHARHLATHLPEISKVKKLTVIELRSTRSLFGHLKERLRVTLKVLSQFYRSHDLCWVTHLDLSPLARLLRIIGGPSYILSCHGIEIQRGLPPHKSWGLRGADHIAAVSRWTRSILVEQQKITAEKIHIFPNTFTSFANIPEKDQGKSFLKERFSLGTGPIFLYLGRLRPEDRGKGYAVVLEIVARLKDEGIHATLIAAGAGPDRGWLQALASDFGIAEQLICPGRVPDKEISFYFSGADLFTMPSIKEGFGIVFLEALAHGTPVLAGNQDGARDPTRDGELGLLCDPKDKELATQEIKQFLENPYHPLKDRKFLMRRVHELFGETAYRERLEALLKETNLVLNR